MGESGWTARRIGERHDTLIHGPAPAEEGTCAGTVSLRIGTCGPVEGRACPLCRRNHIENDTVEEVSGTTSSNIQPIRANIQSSSIQMAKDTIVKIIYIHEYVDSIRRWTLMHACIQSCLELQINSSEPCINIS